MNNKINFTYADPEAFRKFLKSLPVKDRANLVDSINRVERYGILESQKMQWTKKLDKNLYEIRSKFASNIQRTIYFHYQNHNYVITHGFTKKKSENSS